jgi:hypothetical protein
VLLADQVALLLMHFLQDDAESLRFLLPLHSLALKGV